MSRHVLNELSVSLSCTPREVIPRGKTLMIHSDIPLHPQCCHAVRFANVLDDITAQTTLNDEGNTLEIATANLTPGEWNLTIDRLSDKLENTLAEHTNIPLFICNVKTEIPEGCRIEHIMRLAIDGLSCHRLNTSEDPSEKVTYLETIKVVNCKTKEMNIQSHAFHTDGTRSNGEEFLEELRARRLKQTGRTSQSLRQAMEKLADGETIETVVVPKIDTLNNELNVMKNPKAEGYKGIGDKVTNMLQECSSTVCKTLQKLGIELLDEQPLYHFVHAKATKLQIDKLSQADEIDRIMLRDTSGVSDLRDSMNISRAFDAQTFGYSGKGVRVAIFEDGPWDFSNIPENGHWEASRAIDPTNIQEVRNNEHARLTNAIIRNTESSDAPGGYAPNCTRFLANSYRNDALDWAVNKMNCTVVNQSFHRTSEQTDPALSSDDLLKDIMARLPPYPTIVQAAGNVSVTNEYVNHKGYNSITVGSHDDRATTMAFDSVFLNPGTDRELPLMTANGEDVTALGYTKSGTSFASPAVAGGVALIQQADTALQSMPAACRAIMLASADRTTSTRTWWADVVVGTDRHEGSGALNCLDAVNITHHRNTGRPQQYGWDGGVLLRSWLDPTTNLIWGQNLFVRVPKETEDARRFTVKVAVTWDAMTRDDFSPFDADLPSRLYRNFDLLVFDEMGRQVDNSSSFDNNYEIVEFRSLPAREYRIVLRLTKSEDPDDVRDELATYGLAWKCVVAR